MSVGNRGQSMSGDRGVSRYNRRSRHRPGAGHTDDPQKMARAMTKRAARRLRRLAEQEAGGWR